MRSDTAHPDPATLQAFATGGVDPGGVARHVEGCGRCSALAQSLGGCHGTHVVDPDFYEGKRLYREGGMGRTFTARDTRIGRIVIIKEPAIAPGGGGGRAGARMRQRLLRERRILGLVEHPAIVPIYETGQWPDGTPFFSMRRIDGPTLVEVIAQAPRFDQRIVMLPQFVSITEAIAHAHERGVVHRDLTPDNMMLGPFGEPYVIDWGIATLTAEGLDPALDSVEPARDGLTRGGIGKEPYAPIEQLTGRAPTPGFDVYSLGVTLHHLLSGKPPRQLPNGALARLPRQCPEELVSIVARATSVSPQTRFANAGELAQELRRYQEGRLVDAHRYTLQARARRWSRAHRSWLALAAAVAIAATGTLVARQAHRKRVAAENKAAEAVVAAQTARRQKTEAEGKAEAARQKHDEAMARWGQATHRSRKLAKQLEQQRQLGSLQVDTLTKAMEAEREAGREAMELRLAADEARNEAERAAERARVAEREARSQARDAQAAQEQAERRAARAEMRAQASDLRVRTLEQRLAVTMAALERLEASTSVNEGKAAEEVPAAPSTDSANAARGETERPAEDGAGEAPRSPAPPAPSPAPLPRGPQKNEAQQP